MFANSAKDLVRPMLQRLEPYVPGEQPRVAGLVKLNTNENAYPPAPAVLKAVKAAVDARLRLYPNPSAQALREKLAKIHRCLPENIIVGNGSDELLAMAVRAFVEPGSRYGAAWAVRRSYVQYFWPSYSLYPVLAALHGAVSNPVPLNPDFSLPSMAELKRGRVWSLVAPLTFVTTPNAPSGRGYSLKELEPICRAQRGVVVLDEAYVDFAGADALALSLKYPNVLVARTFSKGYSLCFQRVGYFVGAPALIDALHKIRDSYNVNGLGQVAALATLDNLPYYRANFRRIAATRERLGRQLSDLGFKVFPSQTNFLLVRPPGPLPAEKWLDALRRRKVLVRWFRQAETRNYLRITIGTDSDTAALLKACKQILKQSA